MNELVQLAKLNDLKSNISLELLNQLFGESFKRNRLNVVGINSVSLDLSSKTIPYLLVDLEIKKSANSYTIQIMIVYDMFTNTFKLN